MGHPMNARVRLYIGSVGVVWLAGACGGDGAKTDSASGGVDAVSADSGAAASDATPVTMAQVTRTTIDETVTGPGVTDAVQDERVRAPFAGKLVTMRVNLGDRVAQGEVIGALVAQNSEAALQGARAMVRSARTPAERADAERAVALAEHDIVETPLRAPRAGVVIARPASPGELVAEGDSIASIAATGSMVFYADVPQAELARIHPGQGALVALTARGAAIPGVVHSVLPADTGSTVSMRVRVDLLEAPFPVTVGLFGTARIIVARHRDVTAVPRPALLRDDISGVTKVALVNQRNEAAWVNVTPGVADSMWVEIRSPVLSPGQRVITTGQVGLPDSTRVVAAAPDDSTATTGALGVAGGGSGQQGGGGARTRTGGAADGSPGGGGGGGTANNTGNAAAAGTRSGAGGAQGVGGGNRASSLGAPGRGAGTAPNATHPSAPLRPPRGAPRGGQPTPASGRPAPASHAADGR